MFSIFSECHDCYIEFSGDNLENPVDSFEGGPKACQALCASTPGCKYFTWRNAGTCLLKTKIGNKNPNLNAISGDAIDKCSAGKGSKIRCFIIKFKVNPYDIRIKAQKSFCF